MLSMVHLYKSKIISLVFLNVEREVVALAPCCQVPDHLSGGSLIIVGDETQDDGVIRKLKDGVGAVCGYTVMRVQGVQEASLGSD